MSPICFNITAIISARHRKAQRTGTCKKLHLLTPHSQNPSEAELTFINAHIIFIPITVYTKKAARRIKEERKSAIDPNFVYFI